MALPSPTGILTWLCPKESTAPDPVELMRALSDARTVDATMAYYSADTVYDMSRMGMVVFEGRVAVRGFLEDWDNHYEEYNDENGLMAEESTAPDLVERVRTISVGSTGNGRAREVFVYLCVAGMAVRVTAYHDVDEARTAVERLAESRG